MSRPPACDRWLGSVNAPSGFERPFLSVRRRKVLLTYSPFRQTWTRQDPDLSRVKIATACALRVQRRRKGRKSRVGVERRAHEAA
jgi:hypothetical protein